MNLYEKLNRLDDSLFESKRVFKKKKLTEGYRVDPEISKFNVGDRVAERYNDSEFNVGTIVEIKKDAEGTQYFVKWDYSDREDEEWLYGDVLSLWIEDETANDYDSLEEKLTESVEDLDRKEEFLKSCFTKWEILDLAEAHTDFTGRTYEEAFDYILNNWDNFYFEDEYEVFCDDILDDDIDEMLTEATEKTIYSVDYYEPKLNKWIRYYSDSNVDKVKKYLDTPMVGNPMRRLAEYKVTGVRNPKYTLVKELDVSYGKQGKSLTEGNNVSSQLPPAIDSFLQDIAQMYKTIDYTDIMQHEYCEEDLRKLKNLRRRFRAEIPYEGDKEADAILNDIAEKVALIVKR